MAQEEELQKYHEDSGRPVIPWSVKNKLFMAQKGKCFYCGYTHRMKYLEIDHMYPASGGGGDDIGNLQLLCTQCNMRKGIQSDEEFRSRYWRLLPPDGSIPSSPIHQSRFSDETQRTRASRQVRAIYRERFTAYRWGRWNIYFLLAEAALGLARLLVEAAVLLMLASIRGAQFLWRRRFSRDRSN